METSRCVRSGRFWGRQRELGQFLQICTLAVLMGACSLSAGSVKDERLVFPYAPGIFYLTSFGSQDDVERPSWFRRWIIGEDRYAGASTISKPTGVATTPGKVFINDGRANSGYWVFDLNTRALRLVRDRRLAGSTGLAADPRGYKYLVVPGLREAKHKGQVATEDERGSIFVFDESDRRVQEASFSGRPIDIAVLGERLFVTDALRHRVVILDKHTLETVGAFGKPGAGESEFMFPRGLSVGGEGRLYVGDTFNGRIKIFEPDGKFVAQYGQRAQQLGSFLYLSGVGADHENRVYAVDSGYYSKQERDEVQYFDGSKFYFKGEPVPSLDASQADRKNALIGYFQKPFGTADGAHSDSSGTLYRPVSIAIDYDNVEYFREFTPEGYRIEYLIWLTSQGAYSGKNLSVFAYATRP